MLYEKRLNGSVEDFATVIGYTATCTLVEWFGGRQLWVPNVADEAHEIGRIIGIAPFRRLVAEYGNQNLEIPTDYFREITRRDRIITMMFRAGHGSKSIAATIGLGEKQVQNCRRRLEQAGILMEGPSTGVKYRSEVPE